MDTLFVTGLEIEAILGILPAERITPQRVVVDVEYALDTRAAAASGDIADTVSYATVAEAVSSWVVEGQFELVETLAETVVTRLREEFSLAWVRLRVTKPEAVANASGVGIEIERGQRL